MQFSLAFSPCPNDTFIFDALVHGKIELPFKVSPYLADVEALNQQSNGGRFDITKISYAHYPHVSQHYQLLSTGGALGRGCGPLLVQAGHSPVPPTGSELVAIPGFGTTANSLLSMAYPMLTNKKAYLFSDIEQAVLSNSAQLGLLIHESRFTYQERGLQLVADLGQWWETLTGLPLPLGAIAVRRSLPEAVKQAISEAIAESIQYAGQNPDSSSAYIAAHAQEMDAEVQKQHIALYVNDYSRSLGAVGLSAVHRYFEELEECGFAPAPCTPIFADIE